MPFKSSVVVVETVDTVALVEDDRVLEEEEAT